MHFIQGQGAYRRGIYAAWQDTLVFEPFGKWKGSPYRLAHQPQIMAAVFDATVRADLLQNGLDPFYKQGDSHFRK
jgi:hypothetical protein